MRKFGKEVRWGFEEDGAAIGIGWGRKIIAERREAENLWGYGKRENL